MPDKDLELFEGLAAGNKAIFDQNAKSNPEENRSATTEAPKGEVKAENVSMRVLIPAFMISELKKAFEIGFMLMIPFLVIDVIISALLMSMGMMMLPPVLISLPFKIIFFVLVDGWYLVAGSLARSYV
jgi:flagellar biosynthetic protein FliP